MTSKALLLNDTPQFLFADHGGDFGAAPTTAANSFIAGIPTDVQIDTGAVAVDGARHSAKADLGAVRPSAYTVDACFEHVATPTAGGTVDMYWSASPSVTAGTGNPGSVTGSDAAYTETADLLGQLDYIGSLPIGAATVNIGRVGILKPRHRYGSLVIVNSASTAVATVVDEVHVTFTPMVMQGQAI